MRRGVFCTRVRIEKKMHPQPNFLLGTYRYIRFVSNFDNNAYFFWVAFSFVRFSQNNCESSGPNLFWVSIISKVLYLTGGNILVCAEMLTRLDAERNFSSL